MSMPTRCRRRSNQLDALIPQAGPKGDKGDAGQRGAPGQDGSVTFIGLNDTPADYTDAAGKVGEGQRGGQGN